MSKGGEIIPFPAKPRGGNQPSHEVAMDGQSGEPNGSHCGTLPYGPMYCDGEFAGEQRIGLNIIDTSVFLEVLIAEIDAARQKLTAEQAERLALLSHAILGNMLTVSNAECDALASSVLTGQTFIGGGPF